MVKSCAECFFCETVMLFFSSWESALGSWDLRTNLQFLGVLRIGARVQSQQLWEGCPWWRQDRRMGGWMPSVAYCHFI